MSASCSMEPDSRRSESTGRWPLRLSTGTIELGEHDDGMFGFLAMPLIPAEISAISIWRFVLGSTTAAVTKAAGSRS